MAVTALTSLDDEALLEIGVDRSMERHVEELAALASRAGLDGVVASPQELEDAARSDFPQLTIVTPGIRASSAPADDQSRTLSASEALAAGASYLVVGRPIVAAADPARRRRRHRAIVRLTIYSKPGCHLCDEMKSLVHRVIASIRPTPITVDEIDISSDPALLDRYGLEIPVLLIDGKKVAKYRVSEEELTQMIGGTKGRRA